MKIWAEGAKLASALIPLAVAAHQHVAHWRVRCGIFGLYGLMLVLAVRA